MDGGETSVKCEKMIIATGTKPLLPNIKGITADGVLTSDELLDMDILPQSMAIIGAGVIGVEFTNMLSDAGVKVTVVDIANSILSDMDTEIVTELYKILRRKGISFKLSASVRKINRIDDGLSLSYTSNGKDVIIIREKILAVAVNEHMETSVSGV